MSGAFRLAGEGLTLLMSMMSLGRTWIFYLIVPLVLTLILFGAGSSDDIRLTALVNFLATLGIGTATHTLYLLGERRRFVLPFGLHHVVFLVVGTAIGTELALGALSFVGSFDVWSLRLALWIIGSVVGCVNASISVLYRRLREKAQTEELKAEQAQRAAVRAELDALRARVHPHFLFNALNTVAALIEEESKEEAVEAVERLSALMRYSLEGGADQEVALSDELRCVLGLSESRSAQVPDPAEGSNRRRSDFGTRVTLYS